MIWIIAVMLIAGLLGGLAGNLARRGSVETLTQENVDSDRTPIIADILVGIVASFCVPIFLLITQSKLMDTLQTDITKGTNPFLELLYLFGFCLIAAFSARTFMQSVSNQILQIRDDQKRIHAKQNEMENTQDEIKDDVAEMDAAIPITNEATPSNMANIEEVQLAEERPDNSQFDTSDLVAQLSEVDRRVLKTLINKRYTRRSLTGISRDAGVSKSDAKFSLGNAETLGLVTYSRSKRTERLLYELTPKGALVVRRL